MKAIIANAEHTVDNDPNLRPSDAPKKARKRKARKAKAPRVRPGNVVQESGFTLKEERLLAKIARYVNRNPALATAIEDALADAGEGETLQ